jgi:hypothetical protein
VLVFASRTTAASTIVRNCDFLRIHHRAEKIFHGKCVARKEVADGAAFPHTEYTFEIIEGVKGCVDGEGKPFKTLTFRCAGTRALRARDDGNTEAPLRLGLPEYNVGDELVLFLSAESSLGLCAPIGLHQGAFLVSKSAKERFVLNPAGPKLFKRAESADFQALDKREEEARSGESDKVDLKCFLGLCKKLKPEAASRKEAFELGGPR